MLSSYNKGEIGATMNPIRTALVGCGKIGQKHLQALIHQTAVQLAATVDTDLPRAAAAAVPFDALSFDNLEAALDEVALDAVIVATPSGVHRPLAEMAIQRGLHVLVEKPLALSYRDASAIVSLAAQHTVTAAVTQFNRLLPSVAKALAAHRDGRLGQVINGGVAVRWARPQAYYDEAPWRGTRAMDGGVLFNQAIHALDILLQFMGPVDTVFAEAATLTHDIEAEDTVVATLRFKSGALATVNATTCVPLSNLEERITVVGDRGAIVIGPTVHQIHTWRIADQDEDAVRLQLDETGTRTGWQSHWEALGDFAEAIRNGTEPRLSAASSLAAIAVVEALTLSAAGRRPVSIEEVTGS